MRVKGLVWRKRRSRYRSRRKEGTGTEQPAASSLSTRPAPAVRARHSNAQRVSHMCTFLERSLASRDWPLASTMLPTLPVTSATVHLEHPQAFGLPPPQSSQVSHVSPSTHHQAHSKESLFIGQRTSRVFKLRLQPFQFSN